MTQTGSLTSAISEFMDGRLAQLNTNIPGRVLKFNKNLYSIDAQVVIPRAITNSDGDRVIETIAVIHDVPLMMLGSGGTRIKFPISVGDAVLLLVCSRSIERWITQSTEDDPEDDRHHALDDAVAIPGIQPFNVANDATPQIEFTTNGQIHAGGSSPLATKADIDALIAIYNGHVHPASGGIVISPTVQVQTPITGSTVLKGS